MAQSRSSTFKPLPKNAPYPKASLIAPSPKYYLLIAMHNQGSMLPFFLIRSRKTQALLERCRALRSTLSGVGNHAKISCYKAALVPPGRGKLLRERNIRPVSYQVVLLVECPSQADLLKIRNDPNMREFLATNASEDIDMAVMQAHNIKRIAPVEKKQHGIYLFNYFYADSTEQCLRVWEHTAGWFTSETGLDNSEVLLPYGTPSAFAIVNHCRWDRLRNILLPLLFKSSFGQYVLDFFYKNNIAAMPVLYRMVR